MTSTWSLHPGPRPLSAGHGKVWCPPPSPGAQRPHTCSRGLGFFTPLDQVPPHPERSLLVRKLGETGARMPKAAALAGGGKKGPSTSYSTFTPPPGGHGTHVLSGRAVGLSVQRVSARAVFPPPEVWGQRAKVRLPRGVSTVGRSAHTEASFGSALGGEAVSDPPRRRQHLGSSPRAARGGDSPRVTGEPSSGRPGLFPRQAGRPSQGDSSFHLQAFHACHT